MPYQDLKQEVHLHQILDHIPLAFEGCNFDYYFLIDFENILILLMVNHFHYLEIEVDIDSPDYFGNFENYDNLALDFD